MQFLTSILILLLAIGCSHPKLMTYEAFSNMEHLDLPKITHLKSSSKELLYFGSYHTNDPNDSLLLMIEEQLEILQPDFVLLEGGDNWPIYKDRDSTILTSGEPGFTIKLCQDQNIPYSSIEPQPRDEYKYLLDRYDLEWVVLMYLCRQIDQQQRFAASHNTSDDDFIKNINYFFTMLLDDGVPLEGQQMRYHYWQEVYLKLIGEELDWRAFTPDKYYPNFYLTRMNDVNRTSDEFRNLHMVDTILQSLQEHDKVMAVLGGGHLVVQERLITHQFQSRY